MVPMAMSTAALGAGFVIVGAGLGGCQRTGCLLQTGNQGLGQAGFPAGKFDSSTQIADQLGNTFLNPALLDNRHAGRLGSAVHGTGSLCHFATDSLQRFAGEADILACVL